MKPIRIIQASPQHTGSTFLYNLLAGFLDNKPCPRSCRYNPSTLPSILLKENTLLKTHNINIDDWSNKIKNYSLYFVCSERNDQKIKSRFISEEYKQMPNVLCIPYEDILVTKSKNLNDTTKRIYKKISCFLPSTIVLNYQQGHNRIVAMNKFYEEIKHKPFSYFDEFYGLHGGHRNRKQ
jgi:hypothetical protein